jgi:hypothetical protein
MIACRTTEDNNGGGFHFAAAHIGEYRISTPDNPGFDTAADQARLQSGLFRDSMNAAMIALMWADLPGVPEDQALSARCFAKYQVAYVLGDNVLQQSYVVGYKRYVLT